MDSVLGLWTWLMANWDSVLLVITSVVTAASAVAALTPSQADDNLVAKLKKIADWLALNVKNAKEPPVS